jgi:hypothetical protein
MENSIPTNVQPDNDDLRAQCLQLRKLVTSMLVLLIVISGTINVLLLYQFRLGNGALKDARVQIANMTAEYNQIGPRMNEIINKIIQYGNTHKDFGPIMVKYNLATNAVQIVPKAPATTSAAPAVPAAPAAPKK